MKNNRIYTIWTKNKFFISILRNCFLGGILFKMVIALFCEKPVFETSNRVEIYESRRNANV